MFVFVCVCVCVCVFLVQCGRGEDGGLHHPEHCAGEDALRGRGGHLPDSQDAADPETSHGTDRGEIHTHTHTHFLLLTHTHSLLYMSHTYTHQPTHTPIHTQQPGGEEQLHADSMCFCLISGPVPVLLPGQSGIPG